VAVLTYLRQVLEALEHPDMIHLILHYLLALPDTASIKRTGSSASVSAARKRKSMDLAAMMAAQTQSNPVLYNLVDLILGSLQSHNQQTISVTLRLVSAILRKHHRYAVTTLLRTGRVLSDVPKKTIGAHESDMDFILSLVNDIGGDENFDQAYENHVKDCMNLLESHPCSQELIIPASAASNAKLPGSQASIPGAPRDVQMHTLRSDDPLLKALLLILEKFLINPVETNLSLTQTIVDLAACGFMDISGWLLPDQAKYVYDDAGDEDEDSFTFGIKSEEDLEEAQLLAMRKARRLPNWSMSTIPPLLEHLKVIVDQVSAYRAEIPRFDELLTQRRDSFTSLPPPSTATTPMPNRRKEQGRSSFESSTSRSVSPPPSKPSAFDSLAQRIFPDLATPSRSLSPRGRRSQEQSRSTGSGSYGISNSNQSTLPNRQGRLPPAQFPLGLETPKAGGEASSRGSSRAFSPSPLRNGESGRAEESQAAAFREIEQSILARRVGLPGTKAEVKAIPFKLSPSKAKDSQESNEEDQHNTVDGVEESGSTTEGDDDEDEEAQEEEGAEETVSVSHVLTNIVILQEFLLELAALVQVRTGLFGEVRFV
jgi:hypothetical protein